MIWDGDSVKLDENDKNPITYTDAMHRPDFKKWLNVIKSKMKSIEINGVWILVDPPEGIKPIGCK